MTKIDPYLDPELNRIPKGVRRIHLMAVCGTGMGALACMLKDLGYKVTGSDQNVYPPMSDFLAAKSIQLFQGYKPENLDSKPDLVVVGNAISKDNPEAQQLKALGLSYCSMPQAVNRFVAAGKQTIIVTGTHGKTTTSSLISFLLSRAGLEPTFVVGGNIEDFESNACIGKSDLFVAEADESDGSFLMLFPSFEVITNIEEEHLDYYENFSNLKEAFLKYIQNIKNGGQLLACGDDEVLRGNALGLSLTFPTENSMI